MKFANAGFLRTLILLVIASEVFLRLAPNGPPRIFRALYGNSLSMYMKVAERLEKAAPDIRILALGDSLAMTQFQPDVFRRTSELSAEEVFNAAYPAMSFPSQTNLLHAVGLQRFQKLERVIFFLNPSRLAADQETNTDVFRVAIPSADGPWDDIWRTKRIAPLFDRSRLYGLSRNIVLYSWRFPLSRREVWDNFEYLNEQGAVSFECTQEESLPPRYPTKLIESLSATRIKELKATLSTLRRMEASISIIPSAYHPRVDPFATRAVRRSFIELLRQLDEMPSTESMPNLFDDFFPVSDAVFCDYAHMSRTGGAFFTKWLSERAPHLARRNLHQ